MGVAKGAVATVSANECDFILAAVRDELRVDGRKPFDYRSWDVSFGRVDGTAEVQVDTTCILARLISPFPALPSSRPALLYPAPSPSPIPYSLAPMPRDDGTAEEQLGSTRILVSVSVTFTLPFPSSLYPAPLIIPHAPFTRDDGTAEVQLGSTRVLASVSAALTLPFPDRPNEGSLAVFTELAPMADPRFVPGRPGEDAIELGRIIDRGLRESHAVDTESLCVVAGRAAWALRLDIRVMDNDGNLVDACCLAAVAALLAFRRPEVTVGGDDGMQVVVHSVEERDPIPLTVHNLPLAVTFAFFNDGNDVVMDPSFKEEAAQAGRCTVLVNAVGDVCSVQKGGGVGVSLPQLMRCCRVAASVAQHMIKTLTDKVAALAAERQRRKVKRHASPAAAAAAATVGLDTAAGGLKAGVIGVAEIAAVQKKGGGVRQGQASADGGGGGVKEEQMEEDGEEEGEEGEEESSDGEDGDEEEEEEGEGDKGRGGAAGGGAHVQWALTHGHGSALDIMLSATLLLCSHDVRCLHSCLVCAPPCVVCWLMGHRLQEEGGEKKSKKGATAGDASSHSPLVLLSSSSRLPPILLFSSSLLFPSSSHPPRSSSHPPLILLLSSSHPPHPPFHCCMLCFRVSLTIIHTLHVSHSHLLSPLHPTNLFSTPHHPSPPRLPALSPHHPSPSGIRAGRHRPPAVL
ncbi:unnamed protein product [Closterium sp. NIES-54]